MLNSRPELSVVITSTQGRDYLAACLDSLLPQSWGVELIVAATIEGELRAWLPHAYPTVRLVECEPGVALSRLRQRAMGTSSGRIVSLTKDTCTVAPDWCQQLIDLHRRNPHEVIGGAVEFRSVDDGLNWAAFLCEYSVFLPPLLGDENRDLAASNVSYKRSVLENFKDLFESGLWETLIHSELGHRGVRFLTSPSLVVHYHKSFTFTEFVLQRYYFCRSFAEMRARDASVARRMFWLVGSPALPALFLCRLARRLVPCRPYRGRLLRSLPWLLPFLWSGAWGEFRGYLQPHRNNAALVR